MAAYRGRRIALAACLVGWLGCADSESIQAVGSGGVEARFDLPAEGLPAFLDVPFPSDAYLDARGFLRQDLRLDAVVPQGSSYLIAALTQTRGFGRTAGALFRIDDKRSATGSAGAAALIDKATLPRSEDESVASSATVMLIDLDATNASGALVPVRVDYHDDTPIGSTTPPVLAVYPARGVVLAANHRYAAVVTSGVHTVDGAPVEASATFRAIRDGGRRATPIEAQYGAAIDRTTQLVPRLAQQKDAMVALTVYTASDAEQELFSLREQFSAAAPPQLSWSPTALEPMGPGLFANAPLAPGYTATLDAWLGAPAKLGDGSEDPADDQPTGRAHNAIAAIGTAVFQAPNVLLEKGGYADPAHHTFARDATGKPIPNPDKPTAKIWVTFALPKAPMPTAGYPTVIVQHGLSNDRSFMLALANTFAAKGWASVAIESVTFGARAANANLTTDKQASWPWSTAPGSYNGPDGFVDHKNGPIDFLGGLDDFGAFRDQMRQSVLDIGALVDLLRRPDLDLGPLLATVPGARIDADRLAFVGDSLGAIMGAIVAALEPNVRSFVLNVGGGGLFVELANAPAIGTILAGDAALGFGIKPARLAPAHALVQLLQHAVDAGDPLVYARHILLDPATLNGVKNPRKNVLQIEALWDEIVCNESNEALARAAGFALAQPSTGPRTGVPLALASPGPNGIANQPFDGTTAVLVQASPAAHGSDLYDRAGKHTYAHPYAQFDADAPFVVLSMPFTFAQPYLALQKTVAAFLEDGFAGKAPTVSGFPAPTLDFDADGVPDVMDAAPNDPARH